MFMERLMSVIMLILSIIYSVCRCNTSIACPNWISYWLDSYFMMSNRDIHKRSKCAFLKWSTGDSSYAVYDRNAVLIAFFLPQNDHKLDTPLYKISLASFFKQAYMHWICTLLQLISKIQSWGAVHWNQFLFCTCSGL